MSGCSDQLGKTMFTGGQFAHLQDLNENPAQVFGYARSSSVTYLFFILLQTKQNSKE